MQSFIFTDPDPKTQADIANQEIKQVSQFDLFITDCEENGGIEVVRELHSFLIRKPLQSPYNLVVLQNAHLLTPEAQNALLKTLEEPPPHSKLVLIAPQSHSLLPTIISRCALLETTTPINSTPVNWDYLQTVLASSSAQRLPLADELDFDQWLSFWHQILIAKTNQTAFNPLVEKLKIDQIQKYLKKILRFAKMRDGHVNNKLLNSVTLLSAPKIGS